VADFTPWDEERGVLVRHCRHMESHDKPQHAGHHRQRHATCARVLLALALALAAPASAAGASNGSRADAGERALTLARFASCDELIRYARRHANSAYLQDWREEPTTSWPMPFTGPPKPLPPGSERPAQLVLAERVDAGQPSQSSTTNDQELGVDEPDIVKTDGQEIYALVGNSLIAADARGTAPRIAGSLALPAEGVQLLLYDKRALVIARRFEPDPAAPTVPGGALRMRPAGDVVYAPRRAETVLIEVDITEPGAMKVLRTQTIDGDYVDARETGATARIVVSSSPRALATASRTLRARVSGWLPSASTASAHSGRTARRLVTPCRRVRRATAFSGLDVLTVLTVDMAWGLPAVDSDSVMADGDTVYASQDSLYVATSRWVRRTGAGNGPPAIATAIHRFDASRPGETSYVASGSVDGYLLNQFSLSEYSGHLRVATTSTPPWWNPSDPAHPSQSAVTVLEQHGDQLVPVGRVGGLGDGERIHAVRFIGDRGYVVTFRQTDPLYVLDLSHPTAPALRGELKLSGYSAYLHPLSDDLLLGVGQDATDGGRVLGTQLSLFDLSDPAKPVRLQSVRIANNAYSAAEADHHAFLWWARSNLIVLPLSVWDAGNGSQSFNGAVGFRVGRSGIEEVGRATHEPDNPLTSSWFAAIRRTLVVGDRLFTVSDLGIQAERLADLSEEGWMPFPIQE
jgi:Beta propeller domain